MKLLIVDDDASNLLTLSALLEEEAFEIHTASSFAEARATLELPGTFSAIVLDNHLGDGHGPDLVPLVRSRHPTTKVLLVSGAVTPEIQSVVDDVFEKGQAFELLLERIRALLNR